MIKVIIVDVETDEIFATKMPFIPNKEDTIGMWIEGEWYLMEICYIVYEFDDKNNFEQVEITATKSIR